MGGVQEHWRNVRWLVAKESLRCCGGRSEIRLFLQLMVFLWEERFFSLREVLLLYGIVSIGNQQQTKRKSR